MNAQWEFTDDPDDPCAYCVGWQEFEDDPMGERALPVWPDGSVAPRIYRFTHRACTEAVIAYSSEVTA